MRVYELAKELKVPSYTLLSEADKLGIDASTAMSSLDASDATQLQNTLKARGDAGAELTKIQERRAAKKAKVASLSKGVFEAERERLAAARNQAIAAYDVKHGIKKAAVPAPVPAPAPKPVAPAAPAAEKPAMPKAPVTAPAPQPAAAPAAVAPAAPAPKPVAPATAAPAAPALKPDAPLPVVPAASTPAAAAPKRAPKHVHYEEEEMEPEEEIAASFIGRIPKAPSKEITRPHGNALQDRGDSSRDRRDNRRAPGESPRTFGGRDNRDNRGGRDFRDRANSPQGRFGANPRAAGGGYRNGSLPARPISGGAAVPAAPEVTPDHVIMLRGAVVVKDLAEQLGIRPNRLIADLMQLNILAAINQRVEIDVATRIAAKYGYKVEIERQKRSTERKPILKSEDADDDIPEDKPEDLQPRPPVVTFLGHVDHGKTTLMDCIRHAHVAAGEAGGITQNISAYTLDINGRKITFLDTPGHAAFSAMRARGASLTDIAVIIIAADDGIMPQTKEVIKQARQANVQIMVAINKCDLPTAKPDRVRQQLQGEGLTPEEWGGDIICCEVSGQTGKGVDHLLEMILLQADVLELTANPNRRANGYVVEAQLEQGLGPTATFLVAGGTLNVGDIVLCGEHFGKVRGLIDDRGRRVKSVGPGAAVKCMGLSGVPEAGAEFRVMLNEKRARALAEKAGEERKLSELNNAKALSFEDLMHKMDEADKRSLSVIVKADTQGSSEAVIEALHEIQSKKVTLEVMSDGIGNISATDINKAGASKAIVIGFNIACEAGTQQQARHDGVRVNTFRIIYELIDFVKGRMLDMLPPEYKEVVKGHAEIKAVFDIGKTGRVAGCQLTDGTLRKDSRFRIFREKKEIWNGKVASLKHFQNEASEITSGQECGIFFNGFEAFQVGDIVECYALEELPRAL